MIEQLDIPGLAKLYDKGINIIDHIKSNSSLDEKSIEHILISYDFQSGSYVRMAEERKEFIEKYTGAIAKVLNDLGHYSSLMEVGVGECTTLAGVLPKLNNSLDKTLGFDLSWSRLRYGMQYFQSKALDPAQLFTADLFNIPLPDNSVDVVYTVHSIEPNGSRENEAIKELCRIASKYVVLLEPSYHFGNAAARERMLQHGYVTRLHDAAVEMGHKVEEYRLFECYAVEYNPVELIVLKMDGEKATEEFSFTCPIARTPLIKGANEYYSSDGLFVYPVISDIPCLLTSNAVVATKYTDFL